MTADTDRYVDMFLSGISFPISMVIPQGNSTNVPFILLCFSQTHHTTWDPIEQRAKKPVSVSFFHNVPDDKIKNIITFSKCVRFVVFYYYLWTTMFTCPMYKLIKIKKIHTRLRANKLKINCCFVFVIYMNF